MRTLPSHRAGGPLPSAGAGRPSVGGAGQRRRHATFPQQLDRLQALAVSQRNEEGRLDSLGHILNRANASTKGNWAATPGCDPPGGTPTTSTSGSSSGATNGTKTRAEVMIRELAARRNAVSGTREASPRGVARLGVECARNAGDRQRIRERPECHEEHEDEEPHNPEEARRPRPSAPARCWPLPMPRAPPWASHQAQHRRRPPLCPPPCA